MSPRALLALRLLVFVAGATPWALALFAVRLSDLDALFATLCHQRPERTLFVFDTPMLVCSRCAGLYAGIAIGAVTPIPRFVVTHGRAIVLAALAVTVLEIAIQDLGLHAPWHATRLLTGAVLGYAASGFMFGVLRFREPTRRSWF